MTIQTFGNKVKFWAADMWERLTKTGAQVFAAYLTIVMQVGGPAFDWAVAVSQVGMAVVLSALTSAITFPSMGDALWYQYVERAVKTFIQTLLTGIGAATMFDQVDWSTAFHVAILAAAYSIVTSVATTKVGIAGQVNIVAPARVKRELLQQVSTERSGAGGY
jgi:hypothetical protein